MTDDGLRRVPMLRALPQGRVAELAQLLPARTVAAGQVLARLGEPADQLIIVERGMVEVAETPEGARVCLTAVDGPCVVDKAATLHQGRHTATWTLTTVGCVRRMPAAMFRQLMEQEPTLRHHVLRHLAGQVNDQRTWRRRQAGGDPVAQVAQWLIAADGAGTGSVSLPGGQQGLGEQLGLSRVTINRALSFLAAREVVGVRPRLVHLRDRPRLVAAATHGWRMPSVPY